MTATTWQDVQQRAKQPGSPILTEWKAKQEESRRIANAVVVSSNSQGMSDLFNMPLSPSGWPINDRTAMLVSTVYACLCKLSGAIQQLPVKQYQDTQANNRQEIRASKILRLLNKRPSTTWTAASWKEWIVRCVHLRGDQHTEILRSKSSKNYGEAIGLKVHHPDYVQPRRFNGRLVYDVMDLETNNTYTVDQDDMLHFSGFGFNGLHSISAIQQAARTAVGNSLVAGDLSGRTMGEGAIPQIALTIPGKMSEPTKEALRESYAATYGGADKRKLPLVLTEGIQAKELSLSPIDLQLLESRRFEREDICQALGVPPVLIGDNDKTSSWGTGIEQITLGFVKFTVKPHLTRWEEEINQKLFPNDDFFIEHDLSELLRGDSAAEGVFFRSAIGGPGSGDGWMSINEIRHIKNLPPLDDPAAKTPFKAQRATQQPAGATAK